MGGKVWGKIFLKLFFQLALIRSFIDFIGKFVRRTLKVNKVV